MKKITAPRMVILSFLTAICLGAIALYLPFATYASERLSLVDSLFTATSATCVTGLIVKETGTYFTFFGKSVIFILFQIGGLGIMTFSTLFAVMMGRRISLLQGETVRSTLFEQNSSGLKKLIKYILLITFSFEAIGAAILFFRWSSITDWPLLKVIYSSVFHSVSAFCNAGFSLFSGSLQKFQFDPVTNLVIDSLIIAGGIGFVVITDICDRKTKLSLHSKIVLWSTGVLLLLGTLTIFLLEYGNTLSGMSIVQKIYCSFFQSVTARTAGFNTLPIAQMGMASIFVLVLLMFIGASPGSTGGGVKTTTFVVFFASIKSFLAGKQKVSLFNRSIPEKIVKETVVIVALSLLWICGMVLMLLVVNVRSGFSFLKILFEVTSAFGTVGLSTGITSELDIISKLCIIVTMFAGRVGPLTLAIAIAFRKRSENFTYAEEHLMVG